MSRKAKITLSIDQELWRKFLVKTIYERGKQKEASKVLELLIRKYLEPSNV
jgi:hypothetical protein